MKFRSTGAAIIVFLLGTLDILSGAEKRFSGQGFAWGTVIKGDSITAGTGMGYLPQWYSQWDLPTNKTLGLELALYGYWRYQSNIGKTHLELYRGNLRFNLPQLEVVAGLQQINFGPAQLLRALRWFDRFDPRDPLKIVTGVYALRGRYTFLNNSNIWVWSLYGNERRNGYEILATEKACPEWGGRMQLPVADGEGALTIHQRRVVGMSGAKGDEIRLACDGRWDIGPGVWFEGVMQQTTAARQLQTWRWNQFLTLGIDYTLALGNGLYLVGEYFQSRFLQQWNRVDLQRDVTALMLSYPLSLFDNLSLVVYYNWDGATLYPYLAYQRIYDKVIINLSAFNYPKAAYAVGNMNATGYGLQLMLIYNH